MQLVIGRANYGTPSLFAVHNCNDGDDYDYDNNNGFSAI
jgi:hypothetical protein